MEIKDAIQIVLDLAEMGQPQVDTSLEAISLVREKFDMTDRLPKGAYVTLLGGSLIESDSKIYCLEKSTCIRLENSVIVKEQKEG